MTCSVGVAPVKFVAKLASDDCKPDGLRHVPAGEVQAFLDPLPVRRLWGVGEKTGDVLDRLAIRTVGDLGRTPVAILDRSSGRPPGRTCPSLAHGVDDRVVVPYEAPKSISHEATFDRDLDDEREILRELLALSGKVAARLREDGYRARTVTLKARLANFTTLTRSRTRGRPHRPRRGPVPDVSELYRALPGCDGGSGSSGSRRAASSRRGRSSWRSCIPSAGGTSSGPWTGSSGGSAPVPTTPASLLDRRGRP